MTTKRQIELSAGTIHYSEHGSGEPPIVFVHGLLVNGSIWRKVVPALEGRFRCIVPDWPLGSHATPMKDGADVSPAGVARLIAEFLERAELDDVTLVANDSGGALAQLLVVERPQLIGRLVLTPCDSFDNFLPPTFRMIEYLARVPGGLAASMQAMRFRPLLRLPMALGRLTKRSVPAEVTDGWMRPARVNRGVRRDATRFIRAIDSDQTLDAARRLHTFGQPVLLAWASEDRVFPFEHARRLASLFPDATVEAVSDSYSFIPEDQPERLAELIEEFVERNPAERAS